jgi:GTP-binding protein EngB required for normal cell division
MSRHRGTAETSTLQQRLEALAEARELAGDRLPEQELAPVLRVLDRASVRRSLSADHTVVGFFGATGGGKSSLFNAVTGGQIAVAAARRPTTAEPLAGIRTPEGSGPLLDWLEVNQRHVLPDDGAADSPPGLILLDLPDFDSVAAEHRRIVERLVGQVDVLVWVLDPQKYADAALHNGFLRPLASHEAVTMVVLNQIDRLAADEVEPVLASLREVLAADGLPKVQIHPVSAVTGAGVEGLRAAIGEVVRQRRAGTDRLLADVAAGADALAGAAADSDLPAPSKEARRRLANALSSAAGVERVAETVGRSYRRQSHRHTGWPLTRWLGRLRRDPLKRLNLDRKDIDPALSRSSLPTPGPAQRARSEAALREFADAAARGAPEAWRTSIRRAARSRADVLPDALDQALAHTDLGSGRKSWWWPLVGLLQWISLAAALAGALWLLGLAVLGYLQFQVPPAPRVEGFPVPTLLLVAGVLLGVLLALLSAAVARAVAGSRTATARRRLRAGVDDVAQTLVVGPVAEEVERCNRFSRAVAAARNGRAGQAGLR